MLKIALTGGIGSGKSFVARLFETLGIPIYYADKEAKRLMSFDKALKKDLKALLGPEAYHRNGRLNRKVVARKIFSDKSLLSKINALVHPAVHNDFDLWANRQDSEYVIEEAAIIFETGAYKRFDKTILVVAEEELRLQRVMKRDKVSREQVEGRMKNQWKDSEKLKLADYCIDNNEQQSLIQQVYTIHKDILNTKKK